MTSNVDYADLPGEPTILKSQVVTSSWSGLCRATPHAFTEQNAAMLSSVLNSHQAIEVNIAIMRANLKGLDYEV